MSKMIFKKWKNIIGMYFSMKNHLKNTPNYTVKHVLKTIELLRSILRSRLIFVPWKRKWLRLYIWLFQNYRPNLLGILRTSFFFFTEVSLFKKIVIYINDSSNGSGKRSFCCHFYLIIFLVLLFLKSMKWQVICAVFPSVNNAFFPKNKYLVR